MDIREVRIQVLIRKEDREDTYGRFESPGGGSERIRGSQSMIIEQASSDVFLQALHSLDPVYHRKQFRSYGSAVSQVHPHMIESVVYGQIAPPSFDHHPIVLWEITEPRTHSCVFGISINADALLLQYGTSCHSCSYPDQRVPSARIVASIFFTFPEMYISHPCHASFFRAMMERGLFQTVDPVKSVSIYISAPMERRVLLLSILKAFFTAPE